MNDLRQQQMVAATSSSGSESGTAVESAAATSTAGSAGAAGRPQSNCSANSNAKSVAASSTSEEEQRVSSTSSPAQRDQQLNADRDREQEPEPQQQQQREEALQHQHNQPGHITSTTASPPPTLPPPTTPCDDAPSTTGASASASSASGEAPSAASAAGAAGGPMAATALEVESEERDGHKIILKLSKHANPNSNANESQPGGDERRVEPLRIQLPCGGAEGGLVAKQQDAFDADASSCSSSCAEDEVATTLGQQLRNTPHIVPKLTIRAANERRVGSVVPKLTIKLPENPAASGSNSNSGSCSAAVSGAQSAMPAKNDAHLSSLSPASASSSSASSSSSSSSSSSLAEMQTVPKLMIKTTLAGSSCISSSEELPQQQQQIPKLTIKTGGGGQEHVHTVIMTHDLNNAQSIPKLTIKTKSIEMIEDEQAAKLEQQLQPLPKLTIKNLCSPKHKVRAVLEEKPPTAASKLAIPKPTPNPTPAPMTNGGESNSSSQEFCGFSDPDADIAAPASDDVRRNSDDMVIDDSLSKEHDPKIFHNLPPMPASNGIASGGSKASKASKSAQSQHNVVDMVDLTSSPSPGSSPTHVPNNFTGRISPKGLLIDCLRMQTAIGCYVPEEADSRVRPAASPNSNILLSQLTAPAKSFTTTTPKSKSSKYPQLTERLMANGSGTGGGSVIAAESEAVVDPLPAANPAQSIIESIEILDTPDGSPRVAYMDEDSNPMLNKHLQTIHKLAMDHGVEQRMDTQDNNNENHLKRTNSEGNESPSSRVRCRLFIYNQLYRDSSFPFRSSLPANSDVWTTTRTTSRRRIATIPPESAVNHCRRFRRHIARASRSTSES